MAGRSWKLRLHVQASRVHRWLGLIVGLQVLVWFSSGLLMTLLSLDGVHGDTTMIRSAGPDLPPGLAIAAAAPSATAPATELTIRMLEGRAVVETRYRDGRIALRDAVRGTPVAPIDRQRAGAIAAALHRGPAPIIATRLVTRRTWEYDGPLPAWAVSFSDSGNTNAYVATATGRVTAIRTRTWRIYNFIWGLHIMDYRWHATFQTPWLSGLAAGALTLATAGGVLLYMRWPRRRRRPAPPADVSPARSAG